MRKTRAPHRFLSALSTAFLSFTFSGCIYSVSPTTLERQGSVGLPHRGILAGGEELPMEGTGYRFLRKDDRHFAIPRLARVIRRAAESVSLERPGGTLVLGDLSTRTGGTLMPHFSHRSGRDADLLLYLTALDGTPVASPGFIHVGEDGLAVDPRTGRTYRFDIEREWLLIKALLEDPEAYVQWLFSNHRLNGQLLSWARARGESAALIARAESVLAEPHPGGAHDDHIHLRIACTPEDRAAGCLPSGPERPWFDKIDEGDRVSRDETRAVVESLFVEKPKDVLW